ncbi:facilitated trehalose transporter Tret1-like [Panulirus ornatus]|uniref:facilitated trehalose transporter Tret1-like n=1 Tax=Panulirus ornatus TaxID=150431 RepID=UPI003A8B45EF
MMKWLAKQGTSGVHDVESDLRTETSGERTERPLGGGGEVLHDRQQEPHEPDKGHNVVRSTAPSDPEKQEWLVKHEEVDDVMKEAPSDEQKQTDDAEGGDNGGKSKAPQQGQEQTDEAEGEESTDKGGTALAVCCAPRPDLMVQDSTPATAPQVLGALTAAATQLGVGCVLGFSGETLPQLTQPGPQAILRDHFHVFLYGSVITLGGAVGSVATAGLQVWLGQRVTLMLALPVALVAWVTLAASFNAGMALAARVVQALALGVIAGPSHNYVAELAHSNLRGVLMASLNASQQLGYLLVYAVAKSGLSWRQMALVCGFLTTVVPFMGFLLLPDSPRWLASRGRLQEAHQSLIFFRGPHYSAHIELSHITDQMKKTRCTARAQLQQMEDPDILSKILLLALLLFAFQFTGNFLVGASLASTLNSLEVGVMPELSVVAVHIIGVLGTIFYLLLVEHVGRRPLLVAAFLTSAAALAMLGSFLYDRTYSLGVANHVWSPFASLATFSFFTNMGVSVLSLLREEILPTSVRSTAVALLFSLFYTGAYVASQTNLTIVTSLGEHGAFWLYSFFNLLLAVVGGLTLPETRGRTLEEITAHHSCRPAPTSTHHSQATQTAGNDGKSVQPTTDHCQSTQPTRDHSKSTQPSHCQSTQPTHDHCKSGKPTGNHCNSAQPAQNYLKFTQHRRKPLKSMQPTRRFTHPSYIHRKSNHPALHHYKSSKPSYNHRRPVQPNHSTQHAHEHGKSSQLTHVISDNTQPINDNYETIQVDDIHRKLTQVAPNHYSAFQPVQDHGRSTHQAHDSVTQASHNHGRSAVHTQDDHMLNQEKIYLSSRRQEKSGQPA